MVSSPTSNPVITSGDESSVVVQATEVAEMSTYLTTGEIEGTSKSLPTDLSSDTGHIPSGFDEILNSPEFINGYLWDY